MNLYKKFTKPLLDYIFSFVLIIVCLPVLIIISLMITVIDGTPIIFKQKRIGRFGREFTIYKLKTMNNSEGPLLTFDNDKRITKLGKILRKYKLDEIAQLFNILKGDMSFIGPRPEVPILAKKRYQINKLLFQLKPGITGLSTIEFINESQYLRDSRKNAYETYIKIILPQKIKIDEKYANNCNFFVDFMILLKTIKRLLLF